MAHFPSDYLLYHTVRISTLMFHAFIICKHKKQGFVNRLVALEISI